MSLRFTPALAAAVARDHGYHATALNRSVRVVVPLYRNDEIQYEIESASDWRGLRDILGYCPGERLIVSREALEALSTDSTAVSRTASVMIEQGVLDERNVNE